MKHLDERDYPVLKYYLDKKIDKINEDNKFTPDNLLIFNSALNLISQAYFNNIPRDVAEKKKLNSEETYLKNKGLIDKFINFYNSLGMDNELKNENNLSDFFVDDTNNYGKNYKIIYQKFIEEYNPIIAKLIDTKIEKCILDLITKIVLIYNKLMKKIFYINIFFYNNN